MLTIRPTTLTSLLLILLTLAVPTTTHTVDTHPVETYERRNLQSLITTEWSSPDDPITINFPPPPISRLRNYSNPSPKADGFLYKFNADDDTEYETPDVWDILAWIGAQIGRLLRFIVQLIYKFAHAIYVGIQYGWRQAGNKLGDQNIE